MSQTGTEPTKNSKRGAAPIIAIVAVGLVVLAALVAGGLWFFGGNAPEPVSLDAANKAAGERVSVSERPEGVQGDWKIDTGSAEAPDGSPVNFAGFRIEEELANVGAKEAVGRTSDVSGSITIAGAEVTKAEFTVEMSTLKSDNNMRDSRVRQALDTTRFPESKLRIVKPISLPSGAGTGEKISVKVPAELTVHGVTKPVELSVEAQVVGGRISIIGSAPVIFADFDVEVPKSPVVLSVKDHGTIEFQALMTPA